MRHARVLVLAGLATAAVGAVALAQTTVAPLPDNAPVQTAPLEIDLSKTTWGHAPACQAMAAACAACHGADGNPSVPMYPRIAGQYADYLARSLHEYKEGHRKNPIMAGFATTLSDQDIADVAAYYAAMPGKLDDLSKHLKAD